jgi:hypothetical protein
MKQLLTLNGQFGECALPTADHIGRHTLVLSLVDRLHIINQQITAIDDAKATIDASANVIEID